MSSIEVKMARKEFRGDDGGDGDGKIQMRPREIEGEFQPGGWVDGTARDRSTWLGPISDDPFIFSAKTSPL